MATSDQLYYCQRCQHKQSSLETGIFCGLNGLPPNFVGQCPTFEEKPVPVIKRKDMIRLGDQWYSIASRENRFVNFLVDLVVRMILALGVGVLLGIFLGLLAPEYLEGVANMGILGEYCFAFLIGVFYYSLFEGLTGRSLGKMITKTRVVNEDGTRPSFGDIIIRSMCRFIPFEAFSFLSEDAIGWHDTLSKTRVIKDNPSK